MSDLKSGLILEEGESLVELILDRMKKSKTNDAFLASMNVGTAASE